MFGSSRIYRQVSPEVLATELGYNKGEVINTACNACFPPQSFHLLKQTLNSSLADSLDYILLELGMPTGVSQKNINHHRETYYRTLANFVWYMNYLKETKGVASKAFVLQTLRQSYVQVRRALGVFDFKPKLESLWDRDDEHLMGKANDGFYPIWEHNNYNISQGIDNAGLEKQRSDFLKNPGLLDERRVANEVEYDVSGAYSQVLFQEVNRINQLCVEKGIVLVCLIGPRLSQSNLKIILPTASELVNNNVLMVDMHSSQKYPQFYEERTSFDLGHFNEEVASNFSENIAKELKAIGVNK